MKRNAKLWWITLIVSTCLCVLAGLLFSGCAGWNQINDSEAQAPAEGNPPEVTEFTTIPVTMKPQEQVEFAGGELGLSSVSAAIALPTALQSMLPPSKVVSYNPADLAKKGSGFDPALPNNKVDPFGDVAKFSPSWDAGNQTLGDVAYCTFSFPLTGFAASEEEQTLGLGWDPTQFPDSHMDLYVGFGNVADDAWDWFQGPDDGVITIPSYAPYEGPAGDALVIIALLNNKQSLLTSLEVGDLEVRGLGEAEPSVLTQVQLLPEFWKVLLPVSAVDLSPDCSPVNDQGGTQACTAFAVADAALNYELGQMYDVFGWDFTDDFNLVSPRYVYIETGIDAGLGCPNVGRNTWDVSEWVMDNGSSTELNAPMGNISAALFNCTPDWTADTLADADLLKIASRTFIATYDGPADRYHLTDENIDDVKTVLREQRRVVPFRSQIDFQFSVPDYANDEAWTYDGNNRGGHAMCIVGYDDNIGPTGSFKVRNSWGVNWGDAGYCWITYESFKDTRAGAYCFYITVNCDPDIVSRFCDDNPSLFPPCGIRIPVFFPDRIIFDWEKVLGATRYLVYRDTRVEPIGFVSQPTGPEAPFFTDWEVGDNLAHVYWVKATDGQNDSDFSPPVVGWLEGAV